MAFVLTTSSNVHCPNQGAVTPAGQGKLTVGHAPVARLDGISGKSVAGCTITDQQLHQAVQHGDLGDRRRREAQGRQRSQWPWTPSAAPPTAAPPACPPAPGRAS